MDNAQLDKCIVFFHFQLAISSYQLVIKIIIKMNTYFLIIVHYHASELKNSHLYIFITKTINKFKVCLISDYTL